MPFTLLDARNMDNKKTYRDQIFAWVMVDVTLPVFFIAVFWPIANYFLKKSHAFDRVFHSADLMPLGAILLLAAIREIETEIQLGRIKAPCQKRRTLGLMLTIVLLFLYALCKYYSLTASIPDSDSSPVDSLLSSISYLSIAAVTFCGLYSLFLKSSIYKHLEHTSGN